MQTNIWRHSACLNLQEQHCTPGVKSIDIFSISSIAGAFPKFVFVHFLGFCDAKNVVGNWFSLVLPFARIINWSNIAAKYNMHKGI